MLKDGLALKSQTFRWRPEKLTQGLVYEQAATHGIALAPTGDFFLQNHFWQRLQPRTFQFMTKNGDANEKHDSWPMKLLMWKQRAPFAKVVASSHEPPLRQWALSGPRTGLMCGNSVLGTAQVTSNWATTCHMCKFLCQGRYIGVPQNLKISHDDHYFCYHSDVDINVIT